MSYRLLLRNNLKLYKIMSHRYYCSDGFFVCSYAFLLYKEIVHILFYDTIVFIAEADCLFCRLMSAALVDAPGDVERQ